MAPPNRTLLRTASRRDEFKSVVAAIALMNSLATLMSEENILIQERKFPEQRELTRKKQRMAMDYRASMKSFAAQPESLKNLPEDLRASLKAAGQKLADAADKNARLLRTAMLGTQRLLQSVIAIVKKEKLPAAGYGDFSKNYVKLGTYSPTCKPVTVTRTA